MSPAGAADDPVIRDAGSDDLAAIAAIYAHHVLTGLASFEEVPPDAAEHRRRYDRVLKELRPRGRLQERTHSLFPYLVRHGPDLARRLRESFDPFEFGHYLVQL